jgi:hypothetical protein
MGCSASRKKNLDGGFRNGEGDTELGGWYWTERVILNWEGDTELGGWYWTGRMILKWEGDNELGGWYWTGRVILNWEGDTELGGWYWTLPYQISSTRTLQMHKISSRSLQVGERTVFAAWTVWRSPVSSVLFNHTTDTIIKSRNWVISISALYSCFSLT